MLRRSYFCCYTCCCCGCCCCCCCYCYCWSSRRHRRTISGCRCTCARMYNNLIELHEALPFVLTSLNLFMYVFCPPVRFWPVFLLCIRVYFCIYTDFIIYLCTVQLAFKNKKVINYYYYYYYYHHHHRQKHHYHLLNDLFYFVNCPCHVNAIILWC
jgi:hypothetical protein